MIPDLELPRETAIPTCSHCGEQWIDDETGEAIGKAAEKAFRAALLEKADEAIHILRSTRYPQRVVEKLLGVSAGYFSKVRGADRDPSPHLVAALMLLANDPGRVEELRVLWSTDTHLPVVWHSDLAPFALSFGSVPSVLANPAAANTPLAVSQEPATEPIQELLAA
jgi:hypothetical protein